jgi:acetyl esterase/lipase
MIYLFLAIPGLIVIYVVYFMLMISKATKTNLYHPEIPKDSEGLKVEEFTYKTGEKYSWKGRFYAPDDSDRTRPCIVLYHGELPDFIKPRPLDWKMFDDYGHLLAKKGFASIIFNHRSSKNTKDAAPAREDLLDLINYIRSETILLPFNRDRIILWAFSGGSYICLNWIIKEKPEYIKTMISYYGALQGKENGESAIDLIKTNEGGDLPPILIVKADKDRVRSSIKAADEFYAAAKDKADVHLLKHSGPHGFDVLSKTEETITIINTTIDFCRK